MKQSRIGRREAAYLVILALSVLFLLGGNRIATRGERVFGRNAVSESLPARVDLILARDSRPFELDNRGYEHVTVYFEATITGGRRDGQRIAGEQINDPLVLVQMKEVEEGDRIMVCLVDRSDGLGGKVWIMQEYNRFRAVAVLGGVFFALIVAFGGRKGVGTIVALILTCLAIFAVLIPAVLSGRSVLLWTWITCLYVVAVTLALVNGLGVKSVAAGIGTLGALILSGGLFRLMDHFLRLTGLADEDAIYLTMIENTDPIDLKSIIYASIIIAVLGAALDVGVSISASISEVRRTSGMSSMKELVASGLNVGRDILGTMANTLILVYIGSSMSLTLLLVVYSNSFLELVNREAIIIEILQALIGTIGLLFTIPLTAVSYSFLVTLDPRWDSEL